MDQLYEAIDTGDGVSCCGRGDCCANPADVERAMVCFKPRMACMTCSMLVKVGVLWLIVLAAAVAFLVAFATRDWAVWLSVSSALIISGFLYWLDLSVLVFMYTRASGHFASPGAGAAPEP